MREIERTLSFSSVIHWYSFFGSALQKSGLAPSPQDTRALFLEFDADGNNEISYAEFITALRVCNILSSGLMSNFIC